MSNLIEQAIKCDTAATILKQALGIESDNVVNYCFPQHWPDHRGRANRRPEHPPPIVIVKNEAGEVIYRFPAN